MRMQNESISQFAIRVAWETGHFWSPENPEGRNIKQEDLKLLTPDDPVVVAAMLSMSRMDASRYTRHVLEKHGRTPHFDGQLGPAMMAMVNEYHGRCPIPDFVPPPGTSFLYTDPDLQEVVQRMQQDAASPAFGTGNWKGCHQVGQFHCATVGVNDALLPMFLRPLFVQVLKNVQRAYAGVGLLFLFIKNGQDILTGESFGGNINTEMSFVNNSDGWIGLAIVGQGETCGSKIWCRFLNTYRGGDSDSSIVTQWTTLIKHELGHNCGRGHTNGGVMNPSIVNNLPVEWVQNDPSTQWLRGQFGGVPVPIPGGGDPKPPDPPSPPGSGSIVERQIRELQVANAVQDATISWLVTKVREIFLRLVILLMIGSSANAQVVSSDGRSIIVSGNTAAAVETPSAPSPPVATRPAATLDPAMLEPKSSHPPKVAKTCGCSLQCTCGCNSGLPCRCGTRSQSAPAATTGQTVERFLITEPWCGLCPAAKTRFLNSGGNPANIISMAEAQRRHGIIHNPPHEYTAVSSTVAAAVPVWPQRMSPPARYVNWPGWGTIDLETYNRNCNCSMCRSIRAQQQEYRRQKQLFDRSTSSITPPVTPDQEGTPHALVETLLDQMELRDSDVLADLGCGDGRIVIAAAKRGIRGIGVEIDPIRASVARQNVQAAGLNHLISIETGDALAFDPKRATAATTFLYPPLLAKLSPKLKALRVVASPYHEVPGLQMTQHGDLWIYRNGG